MSTNQAENQQGQGASVGEAIKAKQRGDGLAIGTVEEILEAAPKDIVEDKLDIPEWGFAVKVRSFTASQSARIRQIGVTLKGETQLVSWAEMEMHQFMEGVIEPRFDKKQTHQLYSSSGAGFQRVIDWLDKHSGMDKEEIAKTRSEFQEAQQRDEV